MDEAGDSMFPWGPDVTTHVHAHTHTQALMETISGLMKRWIAGVNISSQNKHSSNRIVGFPVEICGKEGITWSWKQHRIMGQTQASGNRNLSLTALYQLLLIQLMHYFLKVLEFPPVKDHLKNVSWICTPSILLMRKCWAADWFDKCCNLSDITTT